MMGNGLVMRNRRLKGTPERPPSINGYGFVSEAMYCRVHFARLRPLPISRIHSSESGFSRPRRPSMVAKGEFCGAPQH